MSPTKRIAFVVVASAMALGSACHRPGGGVARTAERFGADSLQGIVRIVGVEPFPQPVLAVDDASPTITLDGPTALRQVAGLRVAVGGERVGSHFTVKRFVVVAANGVAAHDGVLTLDGDAVVLVTATGARLHVANPSPVLRRAVGHRVWISGPPEQSPVAYGIIE